MKGPFEVGQRVRIHWSSDDSVLEGNLLAYQFENGDDISIGWGGQFVHFWDGLNGHMTHIFGLDDVTIEILE